jgi:hypothetical protein
MMRTRNCVWRIWWKMMACLKRILGMQQLCNRTNIIRGDCRWHLLIMCVLVMEFWCHTGSICKNAGFWTFYVMLFNTEYLNDLTGFKHNLYMVVMHCRAYRAWLCTWNGVKQTVRGRDTAPKVKRNYFPELGIAKANRAYIEKQSFLSNQRADENYETKVM